MSNTSLLVYLPYSIVAVTLTVLVNLFVFYKVRSNVDQDQAKTAPAP